MEESPPDGKKNMEESPHTCPKLEDLTYKDSNRPCVGNGQTVTKCPCFGNGETVPVLLHFAHHSCVIYCHSKVFMVHATSYTTYYTVGIPIDKNLLSTIDKNAN
jgi:hypothetical protein